ncbi:hypothetical protein LCGC14_2564430 [marine sediment metagenome]|uniref:Uncharacterized protein n=1 Tax=marine sediment metagenome TaxID=412755 RepID=A0A0F9CV98_9ZZZZ
MKNVFHKDAIAQGNAAPKKMTKQQEIREWIEMHLRLAPVPLDDIESATTTLLAYLHSKGVVIKVDRELPDPYKPVDMGDGIRMGTKWRESQQELPAYLEAQQDMVNDGYVAVEELV